MRYFDRRRNRLILTGEPATPEYWDRHWSLDEGTRARLLAPQDTFVTRMTQPYLQPEDGPILEGGCGSGKHVAALAQLGYDCIGVDFAPQTVAELRGQVPELDIRLGDVRRLDFAADSFAGYWSLGVIEHFWDGYQEIGLEMSRLLRPGGYLFLTFPYLSPLRRLKARLNLYPVWESDHQPPDFYQFCLDRHQVTWDFARWGFDLIKVRPFDGLKGTKSEIHPLSGPLQRLYDYRGGSFPIRALRWALSESLAIACAHAVLLIFKKNSSEAERW